MEWGNSFCNSNMRFMDYLLIGLNQMPRDSTPNAQCMLKQIILTARLKRIKNIISVLFVDVYLCTMNT